MPRNWTHTIHCKLLMMWTKKILEVTEITCRNGLWNTTSLACNGNLTHKQNMCVHACVQARLPDVQVHTLWQIYNCFCSRTVAFLCLLMFNFSKQLVVNSYLCTSMVNNRTHPNKSNILFSYMYTYYNKLKSYILAVLNITHCKMLQDLTLNLIGLYSNTD